MKRCLILAVSLMLLWGGLGVVSAEQQTPESREVTFELQPPCIDDDHLIVDAVSTTGRNHEILVKSVKIGSRPVSVQNIGIFQRPDDLSTSFLVSPVDRSLRRQWNAKRLPAAQLLIQLRPEVKMSFRQNVAVTLTVDNHQHRLSSKATVCIRMLGR